MKKKSASLLLTFVLVFSLFPSALAAQRATPTPPDWVPAEEYAVFEDSDAYEPDNWETILGLRREVSWGAIHVASIPKELDKGYSRLYKLATDRQHPDVGALFEMALIETRLYRLEEGEPAPYWTYLMYHFDRIQESLTQEQRYPVLLWNARSVLHYYGLGEEFYESVTPLLNDPRFSYEKLMDSVIFSEEEKAAFWAAHAEELARFQSRVDLYLDGQPLALNEGEQIAPVLMDEGEILGVPLGVPLNVHSHGPFPVLLRGFYHKGHWRNVKYEIIPGFTCGQPAPWPWR